MAPSTTPGTQSARSCDQVQRLPRKRAVASNTPKRVQARHQSQPSAVSATPVAKKARGCHQVCGNVVGVKVVCDNVVCERVVCERVVCDNVVCERVVCERVVRDNVVCVRVVCDNVV